MAWPFVTSPAPPNAALTPGSSVVARSDYGANGGDYYNSPGYFPFWQSNNCDNSDGGPAASGVPDANTLGQYSSVVANSNPGPTGLMFLLSMVRAAHVKDGTSNTYLAGEKYLAPDNYLNGQDGGDNESMYVGDNPDITRYTGWASTNNSSSWLPPMQDTPGYVVDYMYGSAHAGTWNVVFCDGSVKAINYSIDPETHRRLGNRADGLPISQNLY